jgi:endogenous inhibitor of DNA gyrase (YacG/DUF329 family)
MCEHCGSPLPTDSTLKRPRRFCSLACSAASRRDRQAVPCTRCGKVVYRAPWHTNRGGPVFCSAACRHPQTVVSCTWCGATKRIPPSAVKAHNFCNRKCSRAWQQANGIVGAPFARVTVACDTCGKQFDREKNAVREHNYCSKECFYIAHQINMAGMKNPAWRGGFDPYYGPNWDRQARRVRERDGHACQRCGATESSLHCALHVHHIKPLRDFQRDFRRANAMVNLVSLCPSCHKFLEWHEEQMNAFIEAWRQR